MQTYFIRLRWFWILAWGPGYSAAINRLETCLLLGLCISPIVNFTLYNRVFF